MSCGSNATCGFRCPTAWCCWPTGTAARRAPAPGAGPLAVRAARHLGADPGPAARRARLPGADPELPGDVRARAASSTRSGPTSTTTAWPRSGGCSSSPGTRARSRPWDRATSAWSSGRSPRTPGRTSAAMATQVTTSDFRTPFYAGESFSLETALTWVHQVATQERRLAFLRQALRRAQAQGDHEPAAAARPRPAGHRPARALLPGVAHQRARPATPTGRAAASRPPWTG